MSKKKLSIEALTVLVVLVLPFAAFVESTGDTGLVCGAALSTSGSGFAGWSEASACNGTWAVHLGAPGKAMWNATSGMGEGVNEGCISIKLAPDTTLGDIESISWWVNTTSGYPPHVDLLLDLDGDGEFDGGKKDLVTGEALPGYDDVLVAEFAYQPSYGHYNASPSPYGPLYNTWVQTFQNDTAEVGTAQVCNDTVIWLYSGLPGPYSGGYFGTLADFKNGTVQVIGGIDVAMVNATTVVLEIQIEVDNWLGPAETYVDDVALNGETFLSELMPPEIVVEEPENKTYETGPIPVNISTSDLFGVNRTWYNVKNNTGEWAYAENQTYTPLTSMLGLAVDRNYRFYAWANNTLGIVGENSTIYFSVADTVSPTIDLVSPANRSYCYSGDLIDFNISDNLDQLDIALYQWDDALTNASSVFSSPYHLTFPDDIGPHRLWVFANDTDNNWIKKYYEFNAVTLEGTVEIRPETLNLKSHGRWITVYIIPPQGYGAEDIDISTVKLDDGSIDAEWGRVQDGVLMVKFSRSEVANALSPGGEVEIKVTYEFRDGTQFKGHDTVRAINPGNAFGAIHNTPGSGNDYGLRNGPGVANSGGCGNGRGNGNNGGHGNGHGNQRGGKGRGR